MRRETELASRIRSVGKKMIYPRETPGLLYIMYYTTKFDKIQVLFHKNYYKIKVICVRLEMKISLLHLHLFLQIRQMRA